MKKTFLGLGFILVTILAGNVLAQDAQAPAQPTVDVVFGAVNISQQNQDASAVGAQAGDVVRYSLQLSSSDPIANQEIQIDVEDLLSVAQIIDTGTGQVQSGVLVFPAISFDQAWNKEFTFFARINKDCVGSKMIRVSFEGQPVDVTLNCGGGLIKTGPNDGFWVGLASVATLFGFLFLTRRQNA